MSVIQNFYKDSTILITGGTGFLGKLLVEKLLRSCQSIGKIYLMMRNKNGQSAQKRMEVYFEDQVFSRLKVENPQYKQKVMMIQGDIDCVNLNLDIEDEDLLINNVNIIFHAAATMSFNQKLRVAVEINLHGIRKMLELASKMKYLRSFVHISTVYSSCQLQIIDEKIYDNNVTYQEVTSLLDNCNDDEIRKITPSLIGKSPNTYTFTKSLAEKFIADNHQNLPIGIFRPAIVVSTAKEPISGWIDNIYGPTGLIASAAYGLLHVVHANRDVFSNVVPADMVVNAIIATGWEIGLKCKKLPIYNFVSSQNPITWGEFVDLSKLGLKYPLSNSIWYFSLIVIKYKWLYEVLKIILHIIPAFIIDLILRLFNKKPFVVKKYEKIHSFVKVLAFFANTEWVYKNDNVLQLWNKMDDQDRVLFNFDISTINWREYFKHYIKGIRLYLFKDDLSNLQRARVKYNWLYWIHHIFKYSGLMLLLYYYLRLLSSY